MASGGVNITFSGPNFPSFRVPAGATGGNRPGTFTGAGNYMQALYNQISRELQENVAKTIEKERSVREKNPRRKDGKGNLARVTRHRDNRIVTNNGFGVGVHSFLRRSSARYYRIIEEGSAQAAPKYSSSMISVHQVRDGYRLWLPRGGGYRTQYPIPEAEQDRVKNLSRRDIRPLNAYSRAWREINTSGRLKSAWRNILVTRGVVKKTGPLPKEFDLGFINY